MASELDELALSSCSAPAHEPAPDRRPSTSSAVLSAVPLWRLDVDTSSKTALTVMHLLTGVAAIAGHAATRRSSRGHRVPRRV